MSDEKKGMSPGAIALTGIAAGVAAIGIGFGVGELINYVGAAKRRYPEVAMGILIVILIVATFFQRKKEAKEDEKKH